MSTLIERFKDLCDRHGTTPYYVALDVGVPTSLMSSWLSGARVFKPQTMMEFLQKISESALIRVSFPELARWWAEDYLPPESFDLALEEEAEKRKESNK